MSGTQEPTGRTGIGGPVLKFAVVGVTNNVIGYITFVLLSLWGMPAIGAMSISYVLGMFISFAGNRKWTFSHQGGVGPALLRFIGVNVVGYSVNFAILAVFVNGLGLPQIPVQFFAIGFVAVCTFLLMRLWVFRQDTVPSEADREASEPDTVRSEPGERV